MIDHPEAHLHNNAGSEHAALRHGFGLYKRQLIPILFATIYAAYLASLPIDAFIDRVNYVIYARSSYLIQEFYLGSYVSYLANEPLWLTMNIHLYQFFDVDTIIRTFIFIPAFITTYVVMRNSSFGFALAFAIMLIPGVAQNYIVHIRQGVAISIFASGYFSRDRRVAYFLIAIAPFVHSAFFVISGLYFACELLNRFKFIRPHFRIFFMVVAIGIAAFLIETVMSSASLRQVQEYQEIETDISGLGFIVWSSLLILLCSNGIKFVEDNLFSILSLLFYLLIYFFVPFAGRVIECVIIPIFFTGMMMTGWKKWAFAGAMFAQATAFYVLNSGSYWFGWGL